METREYDNTISSNPNLIVLGIDEAGKGPLAGPVVVAGCVFKDDMDEDELKKIRDSKKMTEKARERAFEYLIKNAHCAISIQNADKIDKIGISKCVATGVLDVYEKLGKLADITIFDGNWDPVETADFHTMIKADAHVKECMAASVIAKVTHDRILYKLAEKYPEYEFDKHKGYGTKKHRELIVEHGRCPEHRKTFKIKGYDDDPYRKKLKEEVRVRNKLKEYQSKK